MHVEETVKRGNAQTAHREFRGHPKLHSGTAQTVGHLCFKRPKKTKNENLTKVMNPGFGECLHT